MSLHYSGNIEQSLPADQVEAARRRAMAEGISVEEYIVRAIREQGPAFEEGAEDFKPSPPVSPPATNRNS